MAFLLGQPRGLATLPAFPLGSKHTAAHTHTRTQITLTRSFSLANAQYLAHTQSEREREMLSENGRMQLRMACL